MHALSSEERYSVESRTGSAASGSRLHSSALAASGKCKCIDHFAQLATAKQVTISYQVGVPNQRAIACYVGDANNTARFRESYQDIASYVKVPRYGTQKPIYSSLCTVGDGMKGEKDESSYSIIS